MQEFAKFSREKISFPVPFRNDVETSLKETNSVLQKLHALKWTHLDSPTTVFYEAMAVQSENCDCFILKRVVT